MKILEILQQAGVVTGLGLMVVFAILICIIILILVYPKILNAIVAKKEKPVKAKKDEKVQQETAVPASAADKSGDKELIAVLTAAISCCLGKSASGIVIKSYKRVSNSAWRKTGRNAQILNKF